MTQYGDPEHRPEPDDVVAYLGWCRAMRRSRVGAPSRRWGRTRSDAGR